MPDLKKVALYYPEIAIPDEEWLAQAVLYYDQVASIVPGNLELWTRQQRDYARSRDTGAQEKVRVVSDQLVMLKGEGEYREVNPQALIEYPTPERDALSDEFLRVLYSERFRASLGDQAGWLLDAPIHVMKGPPELFEIMIDGKYARRDPRSAEWVYFERSTAHLYMSLLAKHLAAQDHQDAVPSTSSKSSFRDISFRVGENGTGTCVAEILFANVLPCPKKGVPLKDVLDFKRARRDELNAFRLEVGALEEKVAKVTRPDEIKGCVSDFCDKKNKALHDLHQAARGALFDGALRALESLVQIRSPALWLAAAAYAADTARIVDVSVPNLIAGVAASAAVQVGVTTAAAVKKHSDVMKGSAFSYVHHVETKLGREKKRGWFGWRR